jgi:hypothetical protein
MTAGMPMSRKNKVLALHDLVEGLLLYAFEVSRYEAER